MIKSNRPSNRKKVFIILLTHIICRFLRHMLGVLHGDNLNRKEIASIIIFGLDPSIRIANGTNSLYSHRRDQTEWKGG